MHRCVPPPGSRTRSSLLERRALLAGLGAHAALCWCGLGLGVGCRNGSDGQPVRGAVPADGTASDARSSAHSSPPEQAADRDATSFPTIRVAGTHREIGLTIGRAFRESIEAALRAQPGFSECVALAAGRLRDRVAKLEQAARARHPDLVDELAGLADGAAIPFPELFAWNCRSELEAAAEPCPPGCSTVGLVDTGRMLLGHDEDGHEAYRGRMFVAQVTPPSGIRFATVVYPGTIAGNGPGLNERGLVQTTNYIGPCDSSEGVPRYFVGRAVLEAKSLEEAVAVATAQGRAFPWHHNLADLKTGALVSLETWPGRHHRRDVRGLHLHTNHLVHPEMLDLPEHRSGLERSSLPRLRRLETIFAAAPPRGRDEVLRALQDRAGEPCKICRRAGDPVAGVTVATALFESPSLEMSLFDGPSCDGPAQRVSPS